jgi:outer membrane protein OmpA-like peptidoglycan-associated protein
MLCGIVLPLTGCQWLRHFFGPKTPPPVAAPVKTPEPYIPPAIQKTLDAGTSKTQAATPDEARLQSPATLGEGANLAVGRSFAAIQFDRESTELDSEARRTLAEYATWFKAHPRVWAVLAGYTDRHGALRYNYQLGMARAIAVQEFLRDQGLDRRKFYPISYGKDFPVDAAATEAADAQNNRVEFKAFVAPADVELPPLTSGGDAVPEVDETGTPAPPAEDLP